MTLGEMVKILTMISAYYPTFNNGRDPEVTSKAWHLLFENDSFQAVQSTLLSYVATDVKGFPPMPGALKDLMKPKVSEVSAFEAWHEVKKALSNGIYGSKEEFEKLSPICKRIVGSPAVLRPGPRRRPQGSGSPGAGSPRGRGRSFPAGPYSRCPCGSGGARRSATS